MGVPPVKNGPHPFLFLTTAPKRFCKPKEPSLWFAIPPPPSYEGLPLCSKDKNRSPFHGEKPLMIT